MAKRDWCLTIFKGEDEPPTWDELQMKYFVFGSEHTEEGRHHWQTYVWFHNGKTFDQVKKYFAKHGAPHLEKTVGTWEQNRAYCTKEEKYKIFGEAPAQGKRTDLKKIRDDMTNGKKLDDITLEEPFIFHQYGRTLMQLETIILRQKFRTEMTTCDWLWGPTGVGKSHSAFTGYNPKTHYVWAHEKWWDGYKGQEVVIINEFRGTIEYDRLLDMIDKWPMTVPVRNREPVPFLAKHIIITSSLPPEKVYRQRVEGDGIEQLLRRIVVKKLQALT